MKRIAVLLADDHQVLRQGLRLLLEYEPDIEVVGEAENGRQAVKLAGQLRPAIVVMDIAMPQLNGLEATRQIRKKLPRTQVLILTAHNEHAYAEKAAVFGASGFLLKHSTCQDLVATIRTIVSLNQLSSSGTFSRAGVGPRTSPKPARNWTGKCNQLSPREAEVLQLVAEGHPNKEIASELGVRFKTADKIRQHLMSKLNVHCTADLTRYAVAEGFADSVSEEDREFLVKDGSPEVYGEDSQPAAQRKTFGKGRQTLQLAG